MSWGVIRCDVFMAEMNVDVMSSVWSDVRSCDLCGVVWCVWCGACGVMWHVT